MTTVHDAEVVENSEHYDVVIVGAGAAGIGVAIALQHSGVENYLIVDRETIGSSFRSWPAETRFITPSFPSNSIGMLDLNSIGVGISPAFSMRIEHPTGQDFADHLQSLSDYFELPISEKTDVLSIKKHGEFFHLELEGGKIFAENVIWAGGEYQYPSLGGFEGSESWHTSLSILSIASIVSIAALVAIAPFVGMYDVGQESCSSCAPQA